MGNPPQTVTISTSWEPVAITGGTDIELPHEGPLADQGIVPRFDHIGLHVNEVDEILHIRSATAKEARRLELPANRPVVEDITAETADIVFAADRYELRYVMKIT